MSDAPAMIPMGYLPRICEPLVRADDGFAADVLLGSPGYDHLFEKLWRQPGVAGNQWMCFDTQDEARRHLTTGEKLMCYEILPHYWVPDGAELKPVDFPPAPTEIQRPQEVEVLGYDLISAQQPFQGDHLIALQLGAAFSILDEMQLPHGMVQRRNRYGLMPTIELCMELRSLWQRTSGDCLTIVKVSVVVG